jgi:hypothetical protein
MKYIFIGLIAGMGLVSCTGTDASSSHNGQDSAAHAQRLQAAGDTANFTSLQWLDSTYQDLGKIKQGQVAEVSWRLKNAGDKPLVIAQVAPGCGCTVAEKPQEPILPGGQSIIRAKFNSSSQHVGEHRKYLSVTANTKNTTNYQLSFRADVTE